VATAALWRTFHLDGKISSFSDGEGSTPTPFPLYLLSRTKLQCMLQLREQIYCPYFVSIPMKSEAFATVYSSGKVTEQPQMRFSRQRAAALIPSASALKTEATVLVPNIYRISKADRIGPRDHCTINRGPGFLAVVRFGSSHTPFCQQVVSLSQSSCVSSIEHVLTGDGEIGWGRSGEKAWSSMNNSMLSGCTHSTILPICQSEGFKSGDSPSFRRNPVPI
jgi:hypothetical protein